MDLGESSALDLLLRARALPNRPILSLMRSSMSRASSMRVGRMIGVVAPYQARGEGPIAPTHGPYWARARIKSTG